MATCKRQRPFSLHYHHGHSIVIDKYDWITKDEVSVLAHYAALTDARKGTQAHALHYEDATSIVEDIELGYYFKIAGKHKTRRTIWIKEVGHSQSLKTINLDNFDGGMCEDWIGNGYSYLEEGKVKPRALLR